ncbi:aminotransferase class I/II-fold pyridoxal phosphate-dependent enzyme [bacterium]
MPSGQEKTPLFDAVLKHAKNSVTSFHTPGHKNGASIDPIFKKYVGKNVFNMDITVFPEVDSLHDPSSHIGEAQRLFSELYGSKHTFFLINGSTIGNEAMFLAACNPGDSVIISRNAHKSAMSGIILSGVWPIWIQPKLNDDLDVFFDSSAEQIEKAIQEFPEAKAVFVTNPTYNGICTDIKKIAEIVHSHGKLLLVDEAHGAHLKFHNDLPISAIEAGADLVVQSTHKTLSCLAQGSVLHYNTDAIDFHRVEKVVSILQSTSPNYLILSSLDLARRQMALKGENLVNKMVRNAEFAQNSISKFEKFFSFKRKDIKKRGYDLDVTKLTINVTKTGLDGQKVAEILAKDYFVQVDCADIFNLIAILGIGTSRKDIKALVEALSDVEENHSGELKNWEFMLPSLTTEMVLAPREIFLSDKTKNIPISKATGYISAQTLTPYPPGIPIIIPGERITQEICDYLKSLSAKSIRISGQETKYLNTIKVVKFD